MSEILKEIETNIKEMENLIGNQTFFIQDAQRFMARWFNFYRSMQQLEKSRDNWKSKYMELAKKQND